MDQFVVFPREIQLFKSALSEIEKLSGTAIEGKMENGDVLFGCTTTIAKDQLQANETSNVLRQLTRSKCQPFIGKQEMCDTKCTAQFIQRTPYDTTSNSYDDMENTNVCNSTEAYSIKGQAQFLQLESSNNDNVSISGKHVPRIAILMVVVGARGDVQPFIAIGQALRAVGHRVRLATHEIFRSFVRQNGLEFFPLAGHPDDLISYMIKNEGAIPSMRSVIVGDATKTVKDFYDIILSIWQACTSNDDETGVSFVAETIISSPPAMGHLHCAQKLGIPLHIVSTIAWSPTNAYPHPLMSPIYRKLFNGNISFLSYKVIEMLRWIGFHSHVNEFRKKILNLSPLLTFQASEMIFNEHLPYTYLWSPSLVPKATDWTHHTNVAGYCFLDLANNYTPSSDLAEFLHLNRDVHDRLPLIYIGFGSMTACDSRRLSRVIIDALKRTNYRALIAGIVDDTEQLPENIFRIGDIPHDWLFQYVSVVCHHGGIGTTAAALRAGKPSIIIPFFGDLFFWGDIVERIGAGPPPLLGKTLTVDQLVEAFHAAHQPSIRAAAERIRAVILKENGSDAVVRNFHAKLPLSCMSSDLEPTFAACYRLKEFGLQISRPVAQVLVATDAISESQLSPHRSWEWHPAHNVHDPLYSRGFIEHFLKALFTIFFGIVMGLRELVRYTDLRMNICESGKIVTKEFHQCIGHLFIACAVLCSHIVDLFIVVHSSCNFYGEPLPIIDTMSGAKAAAIFLWDALKKGVTDLVNIPLSAREQYELFDIIIGTVMVIMNLLLKPTFGILVSIIWLIKGMYADLKRIVNYNSAKPSHTFNTINRESPLSLLEQQSTVFYYGRSSIIDKQQHDDQTISSKIRLASNLSGFSPQLCQKILSEFEQVKMKREQIMKEVSFPEINSLPGQ